MPGTDRLPERWPELLVDGDVDEVAARLWPKLYEDLHRIASAFFAREPSGQTLQPTALVHEAYCRLAQQRELPLDDPAHLLSLAAVIMRRVLVDRARARRSEKHGGAMQRITLCGAVALFEEGKDPLDLLDLDEALAGLRHIDPRRASVVELRFFGGLTHEQIGACLELSPRTVRDDWRFARAWLKARLQDSSGEAS